MNEYNTDPKTDDTPSPSENQTRKHPNRWSPSMATASILLSIIAILSLYLSAPLAAAALALALLSRGGGPAGRKHRFAMMLSAITLVFSLFMTTVGIYRFATTPALQEQYLAYLEFALGTGPLTDTSPAAAGAGAGENADQQAGMLPNEAAAENESESGNAPETERAASAPRTPMPYAPVPGLQPRPQSA